MRQIAYTNFIIRNENKSQGLSEGKNVKSETDTAAIHTWAH